MTDTHRQLISGLKWSSFAKFGGQLFTWAITLIVIRLLTPADYGLMAMASVVLAFVALVAEMGLGAAIIQTPELDDTLIRRIFGAVLLLNLFLSIVLALIAPFAASFFDETRLTPIIQVASIQFVVNAFAVVPESLMRREMRFKPLAFTEMGAHIFASIVTVWLAFLGQGVWALVLGNLAGAVCRAVALQALSKTRYLPNFRLGGLRGSLLFGGQLTISRILWYVFSQADVVIAGKFLGKESLGFYSVAIHFATLPMQKSMSIINQVAFPAISRYQNRKADLTLGIERAIRVLTIGSVPILWGVAVVAPELVEVLLGQKWLPSVLPLQLVAIVIPIRMIAAVFSTAICAVGRADIDLFNTFVSVMIMPVSFLIGSQWGLSGLASAWVVSVPLVFLLNFSRVSGILGLKLYGLIQLVKLPIFAGILMVTSIILLKFMIGNLFDSFLRLGILVTIGVLVYITTITLINRRVWSELQASVVAS